MAIIRYDMTCHHLTQCQVTNLCAAGTNGTGTCQGDSGSSLQQYSDEHNVWIQVTRVTQNT